jgi:hypothetical protein
MKHFLALSLALLALTSMRLCAQTDLLSLSDPQSFGPLVAPTFSGLGTQSATGFVYNGSVSAGDNVFATFASQDWSSQLGGGNVFTVFMSVSGVNPNIPFSIEFFDSSFVSIDIWDGFTVGLTSTPSYYNLSLLTAGSSDYSEVGSFVLTWNGVGAETIDATVSTIAVVPEPSTYALLALSGLAFGGYIIRRRRRA